MRKMGDALTLSRLHDVRNVTFLPSTRADMALRTSSPQHQVGKTGVRGFYIIMRAGLKGLISNEGSKKCYRRSLGQNPPFKG